MTKATGIVRLSILTILIGFALQTGVQMLVQTPTQAIVVNAIAFFLLTVNFYHGKVATTEDEAHQDRLNQVPGFPLIDYILNILVVGTFVFMPYYFGRSVLLLVFLVIMRALDSLLVAFTAYFVHPRAAGPERKAQLHWLTFDIAAAVAYCAILWVSMIGILGALGVAALILFIAILDVVLDYSLNRDFYFGRRPHAV